MNAKRFKIVIPLLFIAAFFIAFTIPIEALDNGDTWSTPTGTRLTVACVTDDNWEIGKSNKVNVIFGASEFGSNVKSIYDVYCIVNVDGANVQLSKDTRVGDITEEGFSNGIGVNFYFDLPSLVEDGDKFTVSFWFSFYEEIRSGEDKRWTSGDTTSDVFVIGTVKATGVSKPEPTPDPTPTPTPTPESAPSRSGNDSLGFVLFTVILLSILVLALVVGFKIKSQSAKTQKVKKIRRFGTPVKETKIEAVKPVEIVEETKAEEPPEAAMKYCLFCGAEIPKIAEFCEECGKKLT